MNKKYGYVTLMYGNNDYFLGTLIFIVSLMKTKPKYDTILLHTFDVPKYKIDILKKYYTIVREITYIDIKQTSRKRFKEIFTKLKIFTITDYEKIIYLDNDMYVNRNLDHVFDEYDTPAGVAINENLKYNDHEKVKDKKVIFNAGFWLIKPSKFIYKKLFYGLKQFDTSQELEQEYVSYYFNKKWTNMSYLYNYQFSLASLDSKMKRTQAYNNTKMEDIYVIHYSTSFKPWNILSNTTLYKKKDWVRIYRPFYDLWLKLFTEVYNTFWSNGINILNLESQLRDLEKYLKRAYPEFKILELTEYQIAKLSKKLNSKITNSGIKNNNINKYTYNDIISVLNKGNSRIYIVGGSVRNLYNDEEIKDIDLCFDILPDKLEKILNEKFTDLNFSRGKKFDSYFKIGDGENEIDMFYIDKLDTYKNTPANYLILDTKKQLVYDLYGTGTSNAEKKIFTKPPDLSYETWLTSSGYSNLRIGRLIKFMMLGYKTIPEDRKRIYNDWYYNKNEKNYYNGLKKYFVKDTELKLQVIKKDIDNLQMEFSGKIFVDKFISKMNLNI